jgi:hypothetical protein
MNPEPQRGGMPRHDSQCSLFGAMPLLTELVVFFPLESINMALRWS